LAVLQTAETVEAIVTQLMEKQRLARAAALTKQLECGCPDSTCADGKTCSHPMRRITAAKTGSATDLTSSSNTRQAVVSLSALNTENNNQVHFMTHFAVSSSTCVGETGPLYMWFVFIVDLLHSNGSLILWLSSFYSNVAVLLHY
jgi:hypothetical protein